MATFLMSSAGTGPVEGDEDEEGSGDPVVALGEEDLSFLARGASEALTSVLSVTVPTVTESFCSGFWLFSDTLSDVAGETGQLGEDSFTELVVLLLVAVRVSCGEYTDEYVA